MLNALITHYANGNKTQFAKILGVTPQAVNSWMVRGTFNAELFFEKLNGISPTWLLSGAGPMLIKTQNANNPINILNTPECEACEIEELPIIPGNIVNAPDVDVYEYITLHVNSIETAPVVQQFPDSKAFYRIKTKAMEPNICAGDMLALAAYPQGFERIVPGDPYSVDTNTNGLVTRLLYNHPDGFLARSYNPEKYPDFVITREEIITVFRIVGLLRINVQ